MALAIIPVATWVGYHYIFVEAPQAMDRALGVALLVYAGLGLRAIRLPVPARAEPALTPVVGVVNGLITGVTGTFVIPIVMYLEALGLDRDELVQMMGITFAVSTAALAAVLVLHGAYQVEASFVSAVAVVPAIAGMIIGARLRTRLAPATFRKWLLVGLGAIGLKLLVT